MTRILAKRLINSLMMFSSILLSILNILISTNYCSTSDLLLVVGIVVFCLMLNIIAYVENWSPIHLLIYLLMITNFLVLQELATNEHYKEMLPLVTIELALACISFYMIRKYCN